MFTNASLSNCTQFVPKYNVGINGTVLCHASIWNIQLTLNVKYKKLGTINYRWISPLKQTTTQWQVARWTLKPQGHNVQKITIS